MSGVRRGTRCRVHTRPENITGHDVAKRPALDSYRHGDISGWEPQAGDREHGESSTGVGRCEAMPGVWAEVGAGAGSTTERRQIVVETLLAGRVFLHVPFGTVSS